METTESFTLKLQSPKAMNNISALAGLLTYSPFARPSRPVPIAIGIRGTVAN